MWKGCFSASSSALTMLRACFFVGQGIDQQQEFVAADARQHVGVAQRLADALRHLHQQGVADDVAVVVVDVLEIIEIDKGQREAMAAVAAQRRIHAFVDEKAIGQAGEVVEKGVLRQFLLDLLARADVERGRNEQRPAGDRRRRVRSQPGAFARCTRGVFLDGDRFTGADELDFPLPPLRGLFRRQKIGRGSANQGLRRGFQVGGGRLVDQDEATAFVLHGQADRKRVDDVLEERAILLRLAGVPLPILDLPAPSLGLGRERVAVARRDRCQGHDRALAGEGDVAFIEFGFAGFAPQQQQGAAPAYADRQAKRRRSGRDEVGRKGLSRIAAARAANGTDRTAQHVGEKSVARPTGADRAARRRRDADERVGVLREDHRVVLAENLLQPLAQLSKGRLLALEVQQRFQRAQAGMHGIGVHRVVSCCRRAGRIVGVFGNCHAPSARSPVPERTEHRN